MKHLYRKYEKKIMDSLVESVKHFRKLQQTHPCHQKDFIDGIHKCQNVIIHRIIQRTYPKSFPIVK